MANPIRWPNLATVVQMSEHGNKKTSDRKAMVTTQWHSETPFVWGTKQTRQKVYINVIAE